MRKLVSIILIIVGILIIGTNVYTTYNVEKSNSDTVNKYENIVKNKPQNEDISKGIVGIIEIPKINLKVAIGEGTDNETLKTAVGHFSETSMPGEVGNFAVAGHRAYTHNKFFSNLDEVSIGDSININTVEGSYTYKVTSSEVVTPDKVEVLEAEEDSDKKEITLITCTPKYIGSHRLVIKGEM